MANTASEPTRINARVVVAGLKEVDAPDEAL